MARPLGPRRNYREPETRTLHPGHYHNRCENCCWLAPLSLVCIREPPKTLTRLETSIMACDGWAHA